MKRLLIFSITFLLLLQMRSFAQNVGINNDGSQPDNSAMLHVKSANKGLLIPQIALTGVNDATTITTPATSLLVYNTTDGSGLTTGYYYNSGTPVSPVWKALISAAGLTNFTESNYSHDSKYGVKLLARNDAQTNVDFILSPKGSGAILAQQPDGTTAGGNIRGNYAVDLQMSRGQASQVASGNFSVIAGGYWNEASSNHSVVSGGSGNIASGSYSLIPGGKSNTAEGFASTAFGVNNEAIGMNSTVSGYYNSADGDYTFVTGSHNIANDYLETVIGSYASLGYGSTASWVETDRLFTIGNSNSVDERTNALSILKNGNTTIGGTLKVNQNKSMSWYTLPDNRGIPGQVMATDGDGHIEWSSPYTGLTNFTESNYTYNSKTGVKLLATSEATNVDIVLSPKGTGGILAQQPDGAASGNNRGANAVDLQTIRTTNTEIASGNYSAILGGYSNKTSGDYSTVIGGYSNISSGNYSTTSGNGNRASGIASTAFGQGVSSFGDYSFGVGKDISANGTGSVGLGYLNTTMGNYNFVAGISNVSYADGEAVLGMYATKHVAVNNSTDRIFAVGNGTCTSARSNALTILKNANTTIGGTLTINGNGSGTSYAFPTVRGTNGQVLQTDGSGGTSWATPNAGTVTNVSGTFPISVATGTSTPVISIAAATTSTAGSMSAADKTKLDGIPTLSIGQSYQGGIIFWLDDTGQHGLIAATTDQSTGIQWYNGTNRYSGTTGDGLYAGAMNTAMIVATQMADNQTGNFAAKVCADYSVTVSGVTYGDWYLPSKYELNLLYAQKTAVGGFTDVFYWSSTESSNGLAWGHDFDSGGPGTINKNVTDKVRAIRAF